MKLWTIALSGVILLGACSGEQMALWIPESDNTPMTDSARLKACSLDEARTRVSEGTVWGKGIQETADDIASACIKKLALQKAGLDTQATTDATNALTSLMDTASGIKGLVQ